MSYAFFNDFGYVLVLIGAYLSSGSLKFLINSLRARKLAYNAVGLGGMPSTHASVASSVAALALLREGVSSAAFGFGLALLLIVVIDAINLRRHIERHAAAINHLSKPTNADNTPLREKLGHNPFEIFGGLVVGTTIAFIINGMSG